ncbi:hypothetical protein HispidOSU_011186, partial [Sigmodon hispidus]
YASPLVVQTHPGSDYEIGGGSGEQARNADPQTGRRNHKRCGRASEGSEAAGTHTLSFLAVPPPDMTSHRVRVRRGRLREAPPTPGTEAVLKS